MSTPPPTHPISAQTGWDASVLEWLAGLFMAPMSTEAVASYRDGLGARFLLAVMQEPAYAAGVRQMQAAVAMRASPAAAARDLAATFTWLFDGPGGASGASPYESAHVGTSGRLFQAAVGDMELMLRQCCVSPMAAFREPADHLSIELALLAHMMRGGGAPYLASLRDDHLLVWVPRFAEQCCNADASGFYAGAVRVLAAFLAAQRTATWLARATEPVTGEAP